MRIAIPQWQGRVSPVFDVAANLLLVDVADSRETHRQLVALSAEEPAQRARQVAELGADVLICGAISRPMELALASTGVKVIPHVCGCVEEVLAAYREDALADATFTMPSSCRRRQRGRRGAARRRGKPDTPVPPWAES